MSSSNLPLDMVLECQCLIGLGCLCNLFSTKAFSHLRYQCYPFLFYSSEQNLTLQTDSVLFVKSILYSALVIYLWLACICYLGKLCKGSNWSAITLHLCAFVLVNLEETSLSYKCSGKQCSFKAPLREKVFSSMCISN